MSSKKPKSTMFSEGFLWGASTASHQVEGGTYNQWTVWEQEHAAELARTAKQRLSWVPVWDQIKDEAQNPENYLSGKGVAHRTKYKADFDIIQELGLNSFRFGIEWSRVEPQEGVWDPAGWDYYRKYIQELLDRGIEPVCNLWHWTMPVWFTEKGGFEKKQNVDHFIRFVTQATKELPIKKMRYIITLNEPNVYSTFGYVTGEWVPNKKQPLTFFSVYRNLVRAHKLSYRVLKAANPKLQIGVAAQLANVQPKRPQNLLDVTATRWMRYFWNWWFLNRIKNQQDFVGINYYFTDYYRFSSLRDFRTKGLFYRDNPKLPLNDLGWYMEPEGLHPLIVRAWAHYKKPIMITENGLADKDDLHRRWWIEESAVALERAVSEGVNVIGYMHWSLLDNFEWAYGWWPRFGLVSVDRHTMKRSIRPSARYYSKIATENKVV